MAQNVTIAGAEYSAVPSITVPKVGGGTASFVDVTDTTAIAADVSQGKYFYAADGVRTVGTGSGGHSTITGTYGAWWGGIDPELIGETRWSAAVTEAANWPLTPTTSTQTLTWVTSYTATASANATIDRIGKGYHGVTNTLDFGVYNYIIMNDAFVHYEYTSPEASLGKAHVIYNGFSAIYHWGARPRNVSGAIVRPGPTTYGTYGSCAYTAALIGYRTAAGTLQLAYNMSFGVTPTAIAPSMSSTSSRTPSYFNVRIPTVSIRANGSYMPVESYNSLVWENTTVNFRSRIYRVPVEYGAYTVINDRLLDMIQDGTFPTEPI